MKAGETCPTCGHVIKAWSKQGVIAALRAHYDEYGATPKADMWNASGPHHPTKSTVNALFGSWNNGVRAAGLPIRRDRSWSERRVRDAVYRFVYENGRVPRKEEWQSAWREKDYPPASVVVRIFGSWSEALVECGYAERARYDASARSEASRRGWETRRAA